MWRGEALDPISPDWWRDTLEGVHWQDQICAYECSIESKVSWIDKKKIFTTQTEQAAKQKGWLFWTNWLQSGHWRAILARFAQLHVSICQSVFGITSLKGHWFNPFLCKSSDLRAWRVDLCSLHTRQRWITQTCVLVQEQISAFTTPLSYTQSLGQLQTFTCRGNLHREVLKPLLTSPGLVYVFKWLFSTLGGKREWEKAAEHAAFPKKNWWLLGQLSWAGGDPPSTGSHPRQKKNKKINIKTQNTDATGKLSTLNHNLNYPFKHSDFYSMYSKR